MSVLVDLLVKRQIEASRQRLMSFMTDYLVAPDHVAVILASSKMDELLREAIAARLRPTGDEHDSLLDGDRGISTFELRILLAQRLGIIDAQFASSLHIFRRLRNDFAYTLEMQHLDKPPHCDRVDELSRRFDLDEGVARMQSAGDGGLGRYSAHKMRFVVASTLVLARLEAAASITDEVDDKPAQMIAATLEP
ncbi:MAG: hypothetical protein LLG08_03560, partial [Actinomycetia bacterium]|nr:hypothetical protein [Actinomycetes bacterium]